MQSETLSNQTHIYNITSEKYTSKLDKIIEESALKHTNTSRSLYKTGTNSPYIFRFSIYNSNVGKFTETSLMKSSSDKMFIVSHSSLWWWIGGSIPWIKMKIVLFHKDFCASGEQPEQHILAHNNQLPVV